MPYVFKLNSTGSNQLENWDQSSLLNQADIESISSTVKLGTGGKVGSSIPSLFARIQLFESAFQSIVSQEILDDDTTEHLLVSDCLDLLQFLHMYGNDSDVSYEVWNKDERLGKMAKSPLRAHQNLARVMRIFFGKAPYNNFNQIVFIKYKNRLIGGTSPHTLVFTSPNWKRKIDEFDLRSDSKFQTGTDDVLFDNIPYSINRREQGFQIYLHRLAAAYRKELNDGIYKYLNFAARQPQTQAILDSIDLSDLEKGDLELNYKSITGSNGPLFAGMIPLFAKSNVTQQITSDYLIAPTVDYYKKEKDSQGNERQVPVPLLLIQGFNNPNFRHRSGIWSPEITVPDIPRIPLHQRTLPEDQSTRYPYLTTGDFFCDRLMQLRFNINTEYFYSPTEDKFNFLLPLKKRYFKFFTKDDLDKQLTYTDLNGSHKFTLSIPLENGNKITIVKEYSGEDIVDNDFTRGYNIGLFPSFKLLDSANRYCIGLFENVKELELNFYKSGATPILDSKIESAIRTEIVQYQSSYTHIEGEFELIEVKRRSDLGLIIPVFKEITVAKQLGNYKFAIDFGTTNTHISYVSDLPNQVISSLDITKDDMQMVLLSDILTGENGIVEGAGDISESILRFRQEFVPSFIGSESSFSFPFRSVLYESVNNQGNKLFSDLNIGFDFHNASTQNQNTYRSNLKWFLEKSATASDQGKLQKFFEQLLWMIKIKCLLNNGNLSPKIVYMIPLSMKKSLTETIEELWQNAILKVFGDRNTVDLIQKTESEMPYYGIPGMLSHHSAINIDIGGGTTDIFMAYAREQKYISTSYFFGGNDIWGDGLSSNGQFDNGFIQNATKDYNEKTNINHAIGMIKSNPENLDSSDLSSLLFAYDNVSEYSHSIKSHGNLKLILVLHLSAIIYKLCLSLDENTLENPNHLSFSGKGSEYIRLISRKPENLIQMLFKIFRPNSDFNRVQIVIADHPKQLTSEGALKSINSENLNVESQIESYFVADISDRKIESQRQFNSFLDKIKQKEFVLQLIEYDEDMIISDDVIERLEILSKDSFEGMEFHISSSHNPAIPIKSSMFFWYLKNTLYALSKEIL